VEQNEPISTQIGVLSAEMPSPLRDALVGRGTLLLPTPDEVDLQRLPGLPARGRPWVARRRAAYESLLIAGGASLSA
jgi:hypothetical protein